MREEYDGIIVGGGHNGLICGGYLARAGLNILVVERHLEIGGGLDSHETQSGFWHNVHSNNHRAVSDLMWYKDLEMAEMGQEYIRLPISVGMLTRDHRALVWYADEPEKTAASIGRFSGKDAETFLKVNKKYAKMAREIYFWEMYSPPIPFEEKKAILERSEEGRLYLEWQPYSILDVVKEFFENDTVRGMFAFLSVIRGFEVDSKGMGMVIPASIASGVNTQMSKGTTHKLGHSLHKMITKSGADLIDGMSVAKILMEDGRASGVRLRDGREFRAGKFVASSINPNQTFLEQVGENHLSPEFAEKVKGFRYSKTTPLFTLHLALEERLYWKAAKYEPDVNEAFYIIAGLEGMTDLEDLYEDCNAGRLPRSFNLIGALPAQHDPTQAPPGKCTAFFWQIAPGNLNEEEGGRDRWDEIRDEYAERCQEHLAHYVENLTPEVVVERFGQTPVDIERHLPNMHGGDWQVGEVSAGQYLDTRPFPECSQYRTPVPGLYMCGASTHPGGNITGGPGYNSAGVICRDLGIEPWWKSVDAKTHWESLAG
ncbi:MAG: NAD(P)/FAD-dependent oxidoreductase [Nitrospinota bacterium]|jgi:phytoene dehydrogenase-like protein|nr:NAD(P)/FAD-dependent oxidoreductase [Nitrospinota bacterium]